MSSVSKLRSRLGGIGFSKNQQATTVPNDTKGFTSLPISRPTKRTSEATPKSPDQKGIDYSIGAHNYNVKRSLKQLYPRIEPFKTGKLKVDDRHEVYWEACGNEKGEPGETKKHQRE